jgi:hypothetical protein
MQSTFTALKEQINAKAEIKGNLYTYKYFDNVSKCRCGACKIAGMLHSPVQFDDSGISLILVRQSVHERPASVETLH